MSSDPSRQLPRDFRFVPAPEMHHVCTDPLGYDKNGNDWNNVYGAHGAYRVDVTRARRRTNSTRGDKERNDEKCDCNEHNNGDHNGDGHDANGDNSDEYICDEYDSD
ncbi:uncharacterized protein PG998_013153 [Apiospora kogelbergensis]|uniref:Uncharacterized protein n=1 Tax=Apiospora kogelbergensis TaxID=1337665 RepID=A0AAW0R2B9_9PEZI